MDVPPELSLIWHALKHTSLPSDITNYIIDLHVRINYKILKSSYWGAQTLISLNCIDLFVHSDFIPKTECDKLTHIPQMESFMKVIGY